MYNEASFRLIGRIAKINRVGKTLGVNIASNYSVKGGDGTWDERTRWNTVTVFGKQAEWVETKSVPGDLALVEVNLEDRSYEKDGKTVYTTDRLANTFELIVKTGTKDARLYQPSPVPLPGRPAHRPFRGLLSVHSRYGLHARVVTKSVTTIRGLQDILLPPCLPRLLPAGAVAGRGLHPLEKRRLVTAHAESGHWLYRPEWQSSARR
jgi:single-strand DNA-binding protein